VCFPQLPELAGFAKTVPDLTIILNHLGGLTRIGPYANRDGRAGDPKAEGKRICIELLQELTQIPAVSGAHIMAPRNHSAIAEVIAEARSAGISSVRTRPSGGAEACA